MQKKATEKSNSEAVRYQITLRDPKTNSFMRFFAHRKSEVIQAALEQYMRTDNRHTRELHTILGCQQADIDRLRYALGDTPPVTQWISQSVPAAETSVSTRMPDHPDLNFDLGASNMNEEEEEEIFGDIDI